MLPLVLTALLVQPPPPQPPLAASARTPAYAPDGRLAIAVDGDLWVSAAPVTTSAAAPIRWVRVTAGAAWDRDPAWAADGSALLFASDRAGGFDVWRVRVPAPGADGAPAEPERLTTSPEPEGEPTAAPDGRVVFVRGQGAAARLWLRAADGAERRVTRGDAPERWPAFTRDGARLAYVSPDERGARLRVRGLPRPAAPNASAPNAAARVPAATDSAAADSTVLSGRPAERPAWAPDGERVAFTEGGQRGGVFVASLDGRYVNLVSARHAAAAWSPDGRTLALAAIDGDLPGYNGDPDRLRDPERDVSERLRGEGGLFTVDAPPPPDAGLARREVAVVRPRAERNAEALERAWARTAALYYAAPEARDRRAAWERVRDRYRAPAAAAPDDSALDAVIHRMLAERPPLRESAVGRAGVSSAHPLATAAGLEVLRKGGNVVDAAVAVSFALGVVEPDASGVGGYGQMLVFQKGMARPALVEFMGRAPEEATLANGALMQGGRYPDDGPVLPVVPGTVAGMHAAWKRYGSGKVPWAELLAPAVRLARGGYPVSDGLATTLATERAHFAKYAGSRALFFRDGRPLAAGDTVRNPDLAWVLEQVAARGADGFYKGEVARRIVQDLRGGGNAMRLTDLARYFAPEREPVGTTYRGRAVWSSAPPVSGGATLAAQLNLLEQLAPNPAPYADDAPTLHAMLAAWQLVPSARGRIADPGLWPVDVSPFVSKDTARARARCFDPARALGAATFRGDTLRCAAPPPAAPARATTVIPSGARDLDGSTGVPRSARDDGDPLAASAALPPAPCGDAHAGDVHAREAAVCHAAGTTAFAVADADGNAVAVTQTLGTWGGNFYVSPGLGFLYNDKLTTYGSDPGEYGARLPNARHGSTLAPTIVLDGAGPAARPLLALGAAGNAWITSTVYEALVGVVDHRLDAQRALELPRFLVSGRGAPGAAGPTVQAEDGLAPAVVRRLRAMGYRLDFISLPGELRMGYGAAVTIGRASVTAGADPRRAGAAGAVP